ncbi:MAG TPA: ABC transporter permease subunit [Candidatus Copromonas avistercoris]|nr:ABC transporter permease subunit [Candidatus Copromonas avistercoris]
MKNLKKTGGRMLFFLPLGLIVLLFECVPLFGMVTKAFGGDGGFTLDYFREIIEKPVYQTAVLNSLWVTMTCTIVGLVIDFFLAMALSRSKGRGKALYLSILNLTSSFSGLPLSIAFITILGTAGVFVLAAQEIGFAPLANYNLYTMKGMFIVYLYFQIPMGTLLLIPTFEKVRKEWKEAARLMNAGSAQFWLKIGIPVMMPGILGTFNMLFSNAVAAYATPYLLVNNNIPLLPIKVVDMFVGDVRQRPELGSALSITLLAIVLIEIGLTNLCKKHFEKGTRS